MMPTDDDGAESNPLAKSTSKRSVLKMEPTCAFPVEGIPEYHHQVWLIPIPFLVTNNKSLNVTFPRETYTHIVGSVLENSSE